MGNRLTYNGQSSNYDNSGQQIQDDGLFMYVYDNNGNIIYKSNKANGTSYAFEYSALNQLKRATVTSTPLGGTVLKTIYYKYDPLGRRISRHVIDSTDASQTNLRKFYYDGPNIIAEVDAGNNLTASYTHSPLQSDDILGARFTTYATPSGALSPGQVIASGVGNVYYLKDHLNTVNELTNASGVVIQRFEYSAFGKLSRVRDANNVEVSFGSAPVRTSFTYTGREYEPELNMYYYRARYYDPSTGRFLQMDPDPGSIDNPNTVVSRYLYGVNNPIMFNDPSGNFFNIAFFGALIGAFGSNVQKYAFQGVLAGAIIVASIYTGGLAAGYLGFSAGSFGAVAAGVFAGAATGGTIGAFAFPALGLGNSEEGFKFGAVIGALGGGLSGLSGSYKAGIYKPGKILQAIDEGFSSAIDKVASAGSQKAATMQLIARDSVFAGFLNFIEPYAIAIGGGAYVNSVLYNCSAGICNIPKISVGQ